MHALLKLLLLLVVLTEEGTDPESDMDMDDEPDDSLLNENSAGHELLQGSRSA